MPSLIQQQGNGKRLAAVPLFFGVGPHDLDLRIGKGIIRLKLQGRRMRADWLAAGSTQLRTAANSPVGLDPLYFGQYRTGWTDHNYTNIIIKYCSLTQVAGRKYHRG